MVSEEENLRYRAIKIESVMKLVTAASIMGSEVNAFHSSTRCGIVEAVCR